eukprot:TRINITY_DN2486_c0_g2_i2.p1 TRINITY_DN2486_c0_g2~~TRINITY_DN2486_c0_g2_i2.p1  ORF type:complete len:778 (-),score=275.31 TRINITY_DN2486_c0_g2_i2:28-2361(-)
MPSQKKGERDASRYSHLLNPIRDLALNWNIDVASELEEYLGELENISFGFEGVDNSLNFAEAALLIQGSTCVYSRKVEFLHRLVFQTLDLIQGKNKGKEKSSINKDGDDVEAPDVEEEPELLMLDDVIEVADNIDLHDEEADIDEDRPLDIRSAKRLGAGVFTPYAQFKRNPSLGVDKQGGRGRSAVSASLLALDMRDGDAADFKMNTCTFDRNGALMLRPDPDAAAASKEDVDEQVMHHHHHHHHYDDGGDDDNYDDGLDDMSFGGGGGGGESDVFIANQSRRSGATGDILDHDGAFGGIVVEGIEEEEQQEEEDVWAELDPHDDQGSQKKTCVSGVTWNIPPSLGGRLRRAKLPTNSARAPPRDFDEFQIYYELEDRRRRLERFRHKREVRAQQKAGGRSGDAGGLFSFGGNDDGGGGDGGGGGGDEYDNGDDFGGYGDGGEDDDDDDFCFVGPDAETLFENHPSSSPLRNAPPSYEEICRQHVRSYLEASERYAKETDLTRRVQSWKARVEPALLEQESHPSFDVHACGRALMALFPERADDANAVDDAELHPKISMAELAESHEPYDICRHFVAALHLINSGNVTLASDVHSDGPLLFEFQHDDEQEHDLASSAPASGQPLFSPLKAKRSTTTTTTKKKKKNNKASTVKEVATVKVKEVKKVSTAKKTAAVNKKKVVAPAPEKESGRPRRGGRSATTPKADDSNDNNKDNTTKQTKSQKQKATDVVADVATRKRSTRGSRRVSQEENVTAAPAPGKQETRASKRRKPMTVIQV